MSRNRKRAIALKAADAKALLKDKVPFVLRWMTAEQIDQVQKVLDSAVVNPDVQREYNDLMLKSVIAGSGAPVRDEKIVEKANQVRMEWIHYTEVDKHQRLDYRKLLEPKTFDPLTDNPDEKIYLKKMRQTLDRYGVWLNIEFKLVRDPTEPSRFMLDRRSFDAWLTLGNDGDPIPIRSGGVLSREALLDTTALGAGYYEEVIEGRVKKMFLEAIRIIGNKIDLGELEHELLAKDRATTAQGLVCNAVGAFSVPPGLNCVDLVEFQSAAVFPPLTIWDEPGELLGQARTQIANGKFEEAGKTLTVAALSTAEAASWLIGYINATNRGAKKIIGYLEIYETAGEVAEWALLARAAFHGLVKIFTKKAASAAARSIIPPGGQIKNYSPMVDYPTNYPGALAKEKTLSQLGGTLDSLSGPGTVVSNRYNYALRQRLDGWGKEFRAWMQKNPDVPFADKIAYSERLDAKYGPLEYLLNLQEFLRF